MLIIYTCVIKIKIGGHIIKDWYVDQLYSLFYTVYFYGLDYFITVLSSSARIANDALNANTGRFIRCQCYRYDIVLHVIQDRPRWWNIMAFHLDWDSSGSW